MQEKFTLGDLVILKSGGPTMTISKKKTDLSGLGSTPPTFRGYYEASWFKDGERFLDTFHQDTLELESDED